MIRACLLLFCFVCLQPQARAAEPEWAAPMKEVHAKFKGTPGTFAHFGDSITVTMAYWTPLAYEPKGLSDEAARDLELVKKYQIEDCWRKWKGPDFGNQGSMTIRWADENVDKWLKKHNPEAALIMFGTNDLGQVPLKEYEEKTRSVVRRCLDNGTVVLLSTIPPRTGMVEKSKEFADVARKIAKEEKIPLVDYFGEIVKRRPDDWDGAMAKFKDVKDTYGVTTLISRDGVHPSNPKVDWSEEGLSKNGYQLRSYLSLRAYASVVRSVLQAEKTMNDYDIKKALTFYASFDKSLKPDYADGGRDIGTRRGKPMDVKNYEYVKGYDEKIFRVAAEQGISGGALECTDVLPSNGRIFYPLKGNLAFKKGGWGGSVTFWIKGDPNKLLKTPFCDPVQITHKGANNGGIWCDFPDTKPRDFRMGVFPAVAEGQKPIPESDPNAPLIKLPKVGFTGDKWSHVAMTWKNLDTGKKDAHCVLYVDAKKVGELKDLELAMDWDVEKAGIFVAVNYVGLLDEFACFGRMLSEEEVLRLKEKPALLSGMKN